MIVGIGASIAARVATGYQVHAADTDDTALRPPSIGDGGNGPS